MQQFPGDAAPCCTQRRARCQFLLPALHTHEQQIGHVGARDQQDDPDRAHHHPQDVVDLAHDILFERPQRRRKTSVFEHLRVEPERRGPALQPDRQQPTDIGVRLLDRHAGIETGHPLIAEVTEYRTAAIETHRKDHVGIGIDEPEIRGHDADHHTRRGIDTERPADD